MKKYTCRKYDGDDLYSWAVFKSKDVKGTRGVIFYGEATPIVSGCSRNEANYYKKSLELRSQKNGP